MYTKKTKIIGAMLAVIMILQIFCTTITSVVLAAQAEANAEITFVDENLYTAIKEILKEQVINCSDADKTITIAKTEIAKITSLNLSKKEIKDLSGIENFTAITSLDLTSNKIENIDKLGSLTNLQELKLANNNIENCTVLESLSNLSKEAITLGSQNIEKVVAIYSSDINENTYTYKLPQIFNYIQKIKNEKNEEMNMTLNIKTTQGEGLANPDQFGFNEETFEIIVERVEKYGFATLEIMYNSGIGQDTVLLLHFVAIPDDSKSAITFEDKNLYNAIKDNIEGTKLNNYTDSKYPIIRDDNEGCIWYDDLLLLIINKQYLYEDISELDLANKKITNLEGLQYFVKLSNLDLSNNFISDVTVLEKLEAEKENANLQGKAQEIYNELIKNIDLKETYLRQANGDISDSEKEAAINKVIEEMKTYIDSLSNKELNKETKEKLKKYFLDVLNVEKLISKGSNVANENVDNFIDGEEAVIGKNSFDVYIPNTGKLELKIGDYVNYTPNGENSYTIEGMYSGASKDCVVDRETLKWKVLTIESNSYVELLAETPLKDSIELKGAEGYNNGVRLLNDLCKNLFSNDKINATARSLNLEDIKAKAKKGTDFFIGETKKYTGTQYYPVRWSEEKTGITGKNHSINGFAIQSLYNPSDSGEWLKEKQNVAHNGIGVVNNYHYYIPDDLTIDLFNNIGPVWLATRYSYPDADKAWFGIAQIIGGHGWGYKLYSSQNDSDYSSSKVIPVVRVPIEAFTGKKDSNEAWTLKTSIDDSSDKFTGVVAKEYVDCKATIEEDGLRYVYGITTNSNDSGKIYLNNYIVNYFVEQFKTIQEINEGKFVSSDKTLEEIIADIDKNIEELGKHINLEDMLLILPKDITGLTEAEISKLSIEEKKTLAETIVNAFVESLNTLTDEELNLAFDLEENETNTVDSFNSNVTEIKKNMEYDLSTITDKEHRDYIGDKDNELKQIILEYLKYQQNIIKTKNEGVLNGIYIIPDQKTESGVIEYSPMEILTEDTLEYDEYIDTDIVDLKKLRDVKQKDIALDIIDAFIKAHEDGKIPENIMHHYIVDFPESIHKMETVKINLLAMFNGETYFDQGSYIDNIIKYRQYNSLLSKEIQNYTSEDFGLLAYGRAEELTLEVINIYLEMAESEEKTEEANDYIEKINSEYDHIDELKTVIMKYIREINSRFTENFGTRELKYSDYIKESLREADVNNNYMGSVEGETNKLDKQNVNNIITRFKGFSFEDITALTKIEILNLSHNNLIDISKLTNLSELKELYVRDNVIKDLSETNFADFKQLNTLDLSHNRIIEANISNMQNLVNLDLSDNAINTTNIEKMPKLQNLNLANNQIEKIEGIALGTLNRLKTINFSGNRIYDIANIMYDLYRLGKEQKKNGLEPIINWTNNSSNILTSWTSFEDFGYVVNKDKVNFENQIIYANVTEKVLQGSEEYVKLPAIFNQVKYISCGETTFLNAKATNDGMIMYINTNNLGEQTEVAEIEGTGIATGTKCYVTYIVATEEEINEVPVTGIQIQLEEPLTENENASKPDLNGDGKVNSEDLEIFNKYWLGSIELNEEKVNLVNNIVPDNELTKEDHLLLVKYVQNGWDDNKLTDEERQKAEKADITGDGKITNDDFIVLSNYVIGGIYSPYTEAQIKEKFDIDGDGEVTAKDCICMSRYLTSKLTKRIDIETLKLEMLGDYKETKQLYAGFTPENTTQKDVEWMSHNSGIVEVDNTGKIKAKSEGITQITVKSTKNPNIYDTITVEVVTAEDVVTGISINIPNLKEQYYVGAELDLTGAKATITRRSGATSEIDITKEMVKGFDTATVTGEEPRVVTVEYTESGTTVQTTFEIKVVEFTGTDKVVGIILVPPTKLEYNKGEGLDLTGATVKKVMESERAQEAVNVTDNMISGYDKDKAGKQTVTVTYEGMTATFDVNVNVPITGVNFDKPNYSIYKGNTSKLVVTVMPEDATQNTNLIWKSNDTDVVEVDGAGNIKAKEVGTATITVTTKDGGKSTSCKVTVIEEMYLPKLLNDITYITQINPETKVSYFKTKYITSDNFVIKTKDGNTISDEDIIKTGYKLIKIDNYGTEIDELATLVVKGDVNCDGKATATDSTEIINLRLQEATVTNEITLAADVDGNGLINYNDSIELIYHRLGLDSWINY